MLLNFFISTSADVYRKQFHISSTVSATGCPSGHTRFTITIDDEEEEEEKDAEKNNDFDCDPVCRAEAHLGHRK